MIALLWADDGSKNIVAQGVDNGHHNDDYGHNLNDQRGLFDPEQDGLSHLISLALKGFSTVDMTERQAGSGTIELWQRAKAVSRIAVDHDPVPAGI